MQSIVGATTGPQQAVTAQLNHDLRQAPSRVGGVSAVSRGTGDRIIIIEL